MLIYWENLIRIWWELNPFCSNARVSEQMLIHCYSQYNYWLSYLLNQSIFRMLSSHFQALKKSVWQKKLLPLIINQSHPCIIILLQSLQSSLFKTHCYMDEWIYCKMLCDINEFEQLNVFDWMLEAKISHILLFHFRHQERYIWDIYVIIYTHLVAWKNFVS